MGREIDGIGEDAMELLRTGHARGGGSCPRAPRGTAGRRRRPRRSPDVGNGNDAVVVLHSLDLAGAEEALIRKALEVAEDNRTRAASLLGINVRTLRKKLNQGATRP